MKKATFTLSIFLWALSLSAQVIPYFSYQAIVRDASNNPLPDQDVSFRIMIMQYCSLGHIVYSELHSTKTNSLGLVNLTIGGGSESTGMLTDIDWSDGDYCLHVEIDPAGGTNYTIMGMTQILSAPMAIRAGSVRGSVDANFQTIINVADPVNKKDAATKAYVDAIKESIYLEMLDAGLNVTVKDVDGNSYKTKKIGSQYWMMENLKVTRYNNGDPISTTEPAGKDISGESTPEYQWGYEGSEENINQYGRLYTWYAVTDSRGVCPAGWHLPSLEEWTTLQTYLINGGYNYDGTTTENKIAKSLASTSYWVYSSVTGAAGNTDYPELRDKTGLAFLPGGYRTAQGIFQTMTNICRMWSSSVISPLPNYAGLIYNSVSLNLTGTYNKSAGLSVRCLRD